MANPSIRQRKGEWAHGSDKNLAKGQSTMLRRIPSFKLFRSLFYLTIFGFASFFMIVMLNSTWPFKNKGHGINSIDKISAHLGLQERVDAVVIDAGSTGSRVLAFTFYKSKSDNSVKLHEDELWHEVKPGLSSYADNPVKGAESLNFLLELAKKRIPIEKWSSTPLVLRATAGLRLLEEHKSKALLEEVRKVIKSSGFKTSDASVDIMDGKEEGIFSWFTSNYLMDKIISEEIGSTMAALDLGGGSTQITYVPHAKSSDLTESHLHPMSLLGQDLKIFTHSYLGLGLMAARAQILKYQLDKSDNTVYSSCINPIVDTKWEYSNQEINIKGSKHSQYKNVKETAGRLGQKRPVADYVKCVELCKKYIHDKMDIKPGSLDGRDIVAFSYYYDKATERGLIDPFKGGAVTVKRILREAREACEIPNVEQPFACLDMTFIATLLHQGYGIDPETSVKMYKKISGHELSWALGLAFHIVSNGI